MNQRSFTPGDIVIYRESKYASRPSPRAKHVTPSPRGEDYMYHVDKIGIVVEEREDDMLVILTRRGRRHHVRCDDPALRRPTLWERIRHRHELRKPTMLTAASSS